MASSTRAEPIYRIGQKQLDYLEKLIEEQYASTHEGFFQAIRVHQKLETVGSIAYKDAGT